MNIKDHVRLLTRLLHIIFWMILAYLAGDVGMGFYYIGFIITETLFVIFEGGLVQAVARMVAIRRSKGLHYNSGLVFRYGVLYSLLIGIAFGFIIWSFSSRIYGKAIGYLLPESVFAVMGIYFAIHMLKGCLRGYYYGKNNVMICLIAEVVQCVVMLALCPVLVIRLYRYGMNISGLLKNPLYANIGGAIGAVTAQCIGVVAAILVLIIGDRIAGNVFRNEYNSVKGVDNGRNITLTFLKVSLTYIGEHLLPVLTIISLLIMYVKKGSQSGTEIKEIFVRIGVFAGKYLLILGAILAVFMEFADREIKKIRTDVGREEHKNARTRSVYLLRNTIMLLLPVMFVLIITADPLIKIFFAGRTSLGIKLIRQGGIAILLHGIIYMSKGVLNAIKFGRYSLVAAVSGYVVTMIAAAAMIGSDSDISAIVIAYVVGLIVETAVSLFAFYRLIGFDPIDLAIRIGKIAVSGAVFAGMIAILDHFIVMNVIFFAIALIISYAAYIVTLIVVKGVTVRDINSLNGTLIYYPLAFLGNMFMNR